MDAKWGGFEQVKDMLLRLLSVSSAGVELHSGEVSFLVGESFHPIKPKKAQRKANKPDSQVH